MYPRTPGIDKVSQHDALSPKEVFFRSGDCFPRDCVLEFVSCWLPDGFHQTNLPVLRLVLCFTSLTWLVFSLYCFWPLCFYQRIKVMENIQPYLQCQKFASFRNRLKGFRCLLFSLLFWLPCRYVNQFVNVPYKMHEPVILTNTQSSFVISS